MPEFDAYHLLFPLMITIAAVIFYESQKSRVAKDFWELNKDLNQLRNDNQKLKNELTELEQSKKELPKSQELRDFLKDMEVKGYGIARIDPDDIFYRGRN